MCCKQTLAIAALMLSAGIASAGPVELGHVDRSDYDLYSAHAQAVRGGGVQSLYSDLETGPDGYVAFADTAIEADGELESAGVADYNSISMGGLALDQFVFVGGVDQAGGVVFFDFFDSAGGFIDGFGVQLSDAGTFIWTIDLTDTIMVNSDGLIQMTIDDEDLAGAGSTAAGRWFLGNNGATIGDSGAFEADPDFNFNFELNTAIPTPGTLALLGFGGLCTARRKR